jgi:arylsulfatase A-like enzyme
MEIDRHLNLVYDVFGPPINNWDPNAGKSVDKSGFRNLQSMTAEQRAAWDTGFGPENKKLEQNPLTGKDLVRWKYQRYIRNYLRCVKGVDESIGRMRKFLEDAGLSQNTVVVYSSDQGFYLGDHGWYDKRWMYEESLKMPLIIHWPGETKPGSKNTDLVQNLDYAETFLEMAGAPIPEDMQGRSLVPLLKGEKTDWRDAIYYHYFEYPSVHMVARHNGVRSERFKLIQFYQFGEWEFYDLKIDPQELANQYENPKYASDIAQMKARLKQLTQQYGDETDTSEMPAEWKQKFRQPAG